MEPDIAGVLRQFKSIKERASRLRQSIFLSPTEKIKSLVKEFNDAKIHFERIMRKQTIDIQLQSIESPEITGIPTKKSILIKQKRLLNTIVTECDKAIGVLEDIVSSLLKEDSDKLKSLRKELEKLSEILPDINYERNLSEAIEEYEKGDYFASALISSRVIIYALNQIPGKSDEEKAKFLREKGIIEKGRKDTHLSIIKAGRLARNVFSHDIKAFPTLSEAHSLLGDAIKILEFVSQVLKDEER
jgi:vacuolar-type H+-ATPase subunit I/STV1